MSQEKFKRQKFLLKKYKAIKERQNLKMLQIRNYDEYVAKIILEDIRNRKSIDSIKTCYLNKLEIIDFPNIYPLFNNYLDQIIKEALLQIILLSRSSKEIDLACSNAATILAKSDFSFRNINLSHTRIPKADLSQCLFINVNFENSYLKEVQFLQSHLINVNFKNCDLSNAKFGIFIKDNQRDPIGIGFSSDNKQFYYKAHEDVIEMNMENQQPKRISLNKFIYLRIKWINHSSLNRYRVWVSLNNNLEFFDNFKNLERKICINKLVFSPNLKYIAAIDNNLSVLCWDIEIYKQILILEGEFLSYNDSKLIFSPCSRYLAIIKTNIIYIICAETGNLARSICGNFTDKNAFAFSYTKIAYNHLNLLEVIDTATSAKKLSYLMHNEVKGLSFSPCGKFLAIASNGSTGYVMDLQSQKISHIFPGFNKYVMSVLFSSSNKYISWTDSNNNIRIYEFFPNFLENDYNRHYQILTAKISPKGTYLLTWSLEKSVLWDLTNSAPKQIKTIRDHNFSGKFIFSPFETYLANENFDRIYIYDIKRDTYIVRRKEKYNWRDFTFSENEDYIISLKGSIYEYYKLPSLAMVKKFDTNEKDLISYVFSSCGRYHLCSKASKFFIWDFNQKYFIGKWNTTNLCSKFNFGHFSKQIAYCDSQENCIRVLNVKTGEDTQLKIKYNMLVCHCFSSDEKLIVGGYKHGIIIIWDIKNQTIVKKLKSLYFRDINWIEAVNDHIIIKEKDSIEIFKHR